MPDVKDQLEQESQPKDLKSQIEELKGKSPLYFKKEGNPLEGRNPDKEPKQQKKVTFVDEGVIKTLLRYASIRQIADLLVEAQDKQEVTKEVSANTTNTSERKMKVFSGYFSIDFPADDLASLIKTIADPATIDKIQKLLDEKHQKAANIFRVAKSLEIIREEEKKQHKEICLSEKTADNFLKVLLDITTPEALSNLLLETMSDKDFHLLHFKEIEVLEKAALDKPDTFHEKFLARPDNNNNSLEVIKQNIALIRLLKAYELENKASNLLLQKTPNLCAVLAKLDSNSVSAIHKTVLEQHHKIPTASFFMIKEGYKNQISQNKHQLQSNTRPQERQR
jgi:hypothetical protein